MESSGVPQAVETPGPVPPPVRRGLPTRVLIGLVLAAVGVVLTVASWAWEYFGVRNFPTGMIPFLQVEILLSVATAIATQVGLFLILSGVLGVLPRVRLWSVLGPLLILVGALVGGTVGVVDYALMSTLYSGGSSNGLAWLLELLQGAGLTASVATALGLLISLFAVARATLLRPFQPAMPRSSVSRGDYHFRGPPENGYK